MEMAQGPQKKSGGVAQVQFGIYKQPGNYAGKSVADVRAERAQLWGIPDDAHAYLGNTKLDENYEIQEGDAVEFHRKAGEKG